MGTVKSTSIRVDADVKERAAEVFDSLGLNFSSGIEIYLRAVVREQRIPFDLALPRRSDAEEQLSASLAEREPGESPRR